MASRDDLLELLGDSAVFGTAAHEARAHLIERAELRSVAPGEALLREGDAPDVCLVIASGLLEVTVGDPPARIRLVGRGAVVGELGAITGQPRSATVRALRPADVVVIPASDLNDVLASDAGFQGGLMRQLAFQASESRPTDPVSPPARRRIALVDGTDGRAGGVVRGVLDSLQNATRAAVIPTELDRPALLAALRAAEDEDRAVMVVSDTGDPNASARVNLADRVVVIADAGTGRPPPGAGTWAGCEIVAVGAVPAPVSQAAAVYTLTGADDSIGIARVARRLAGRAVGVVLSSGGARAFAHIGVLAELEAAGMVIDRVGACSLGCIAGVLYAAGHSPADVQRIVAELDLLSMYLEHGPKGMRVLTPLLAERAPSFARDFFCVSVDLATGMRRVHRDDPLEQALEASMALPGLVNPAVIGSSVLIDGALVDPLPVDVMYVEGDGPIVAVDVSGRHERMRHWTARWADADAPPPDPSDVTVQAMDVASIDRRPRARALATLVVDPVTPFGTLAFDRLDELVEVGRQAGQQALASADGETRAALGI